jgi:hypothetical protein
MGKYDPLRDHLRSVRGRTWIATFRDIETVIGDRLPASAYKYQAWWSNDRSHIQAHSWLEAGWRTENPDPIRKRTLFRKIR